MPETPIVSVRGLRKSYGNFAALKGIDFDIAPGEIFALLGPNGAGKSTCIEILEGFRNPTAGRVQVMGFDPQKNNLFFKERIGFVPQESGVESVQTPREILTTYRSCYAAGNDPADLLAMVGLTDKANAKISQLSGGQKRRLDLALGLVGRPELLFLDEPTTGFSPEARRDTWRILRDLQRGGITILLTSHYMDEVSALADRMAVLVAGRIAFLGAPQELGRSSTLVEFAPPPGRAGWSVGELTRWLAEVEGQMDGAMDGLVDGQTDGRMDGQTDGRDDDSPVIQEITRGGVTKLQVTTTAPAEFLFHLTSKARADRVRLEDLSVNQPTLEDNYLNLIASWEAESESESEPESASVLDSNPDPEFEATPVTTS